MSPPSPLLRSYCTVTLLKTRQMYEEKMPSNSIIKLPPIFIIDSITSFQRNFKEVEYFNNHLVLLKEKKLFHTIYH